MSRETLRIKSFVYFEGQTKIERHEPPVTGFSVRMEEMIKVELNMSDLKFRKNPHLKCA